MFGQFKKLILASFILGSFALSASCVADEKPLTITAIAGQEVCYSKSTTAGETLIKFELCVTQGSFTHDSYVLRVDDKILLKATDDETTQGIFAYYKNQKLDLICAPQEISSKATPEGNLAEVIDVLPNATTEETTKIADLLGDGYVEIEVGRLCAVMHNGNKLMSVQVLFK